MPLWSVTQYRNYKDFKYGSFNVYITEKEFVIRGLLKKTNNTSLYIKGNKNK